MARLPLKHLRLFAGVGSVGDVYTPCANHVCGVNGVKLILAALEVLRNGSDGVCHAVSILLDGAGHGAAAMLTEQLAIQKYLSKVSRSDSVRLGIKCIIMQCSRTMGRDSSIIAAATSE